jgi:hypothetical protein
VQVGEGATLGLGCTGNAVGPGPPCDGQTTDDTVGGNLVADQPLTMYLDGDTIDGNVISNGGGPGLLGTFLSFAVKDNTIGGNLIAGMAGRLDRRAPERRRRQPDLLEERQRPGSRLERGRRQPRLEQPHLPGQQPGGAARGLGRRTQHRERPQDRPVHGARPLARREEGRPRAALLHTVRRRGA